MHPSTAAQTLEHLFETVTLAGSTPAALLDCLAADEATVRAAQARHAETIHASPTDRARRGPRCDESHAAHTVSTWTDAQALWTRKPTAEGAHMNKPGK